MENQNSLALGQKAQMFRKNSLSTQKNVSADEEDKLSTISS